MSDEQKARLTNAVGGLAEMLAKDEEMGSLKALELGAIIFSESAAPVVAKITEELRSAHERTVDSDPAIAGLMDGTMQLCALIGTECPNILKVIQQLQYSLEVLNRLSTAKE